MKDLHQSADTFLVVMNVVFPVDRDRHLPVSKYSVLFFIQNLYPFDDLLVLKLSVACIMITLLRYGLYENE